MRKLKLILTVILILSLWCGQCFAYYTPVYAMESEQSADIEIKEVKAEVLKTSNGESVLAVVNASGSVKSYKFEYLKDGQVVKSFTTKSRAFNCYSLQAGTYIVKVTAKDQSGKTVSMQSDAVKVGQDEAVKVQETPSVVVQDKGLKINELKVIPVKKDGKVHSITLLVKADGQDLKYKYEYMRGDRVLKTINSKSPNFNFGKTDPGVYKIRVTITDKDGKSVTKTSETVDVNLDDLVKDVIVSTEAKILKHPQPNKGQLVIYITNIDSSYKNKLEVYKDNELFKTIKTYKEKTIVDQIDPGKYQIYYAAMKDNEVVDTEKSDVIDFKKVDVKLFENIDLTLKQGDNPYLSAMVTKGQAGVEYQFDFMKDGKTFKTFKQTNSLKYLYNLEEGNYSVIVTAKDAYGNTTKKESTAVAFTSKEESPVVEETTVVEATPIVEATPVPAVTESQPENVVRDSLTPVEKTGMFNINGTVEGYDPSYPLKIIAVSAKKTVVTEVVGQGEFTFTDLPAGAYKLKIDGQDYFLERSDTINRESGTAVTEVQVRTNKTDKFIYEWSFDGSTSGYETTAHIVTPPEVKLGNKIIEMDLSSASFKLREKYSIILDDYNDKWNAEYASALLKTMEQIPQETNTSSRKIKESVWRITDQHLTNDIKISSENGKKVVTLSEAALTNATPRQAVVDGVSGTYFSKKLHQASVRFVTNHGKDLSKVEKILNERYGVTTIIRNYDSLVCTDEGKESFMQFKAEELVLIINAFEEMPEGFHKVKGLRYLLRRRDGHPHPLYPEAPAVAWPSKSRNSYIEFMDTAFTTEISHMQKLIVHEKTHFMWENLFSDELKAEWAELGGWYKTGEDGDGWATTKQTSFVTAYAHGNNPNEDMAESVSFYVFNPDKLMAVAPEKHEFIQNRIMQGDRYVVQIREDLQFEVYNLEPDYDYPGKIKNIKVEVDGEANEVKRVKIDLTLDTHGDKNLKAKYAYMRIFSEAGTFKDIYLSARGGGLSDRLSGSFTLPKNCKAGYWHVDQIVLIDGAGNERFEGITDFGWMMYINNSNEDLQAPKYVKNSLKLHIENGREDGKPVQYVVATWAFEENQEMASHSPVYAALVGPNRQQYRLEGYGKINSEGLAEVKFPVTDFHASGNYMVSYLKMKDAALNYGSQRFSYSSRDERPVIIHVKTKSPDSKKAEIDLNRITVEATPTNPSKPNGETKVKITFYAKDDLSGVGTISYRLRSPQGKETFTYLQHSNTYTTYFKGQANEWKKYTDTYILPKGSEPGTWGLASMKLVDKAGNIVNYDFKEVMHFVVKKN